MRVSAPPKERITPRMLPGQVTAPRLLLATGTFPNPEVFNRDFAALSVALIDHLHEQGVMLVGIDTPSVDLFESKDLEAHQAFRRHDLAILEGLILANVPEGMYELIALPLRLEGFDASPVRAVLRA
jgi:arylformamidase